MLNLKPIQLIGFWLSIVLHLTAVFAPSAWARDGNFIGACGGILSSLIQIAARPFLETQTDTDVLELNQLLKLKQYRKNKWMVVGDDVIRGAINRRFVLEKDLQVSGHPQPSNNMTYAVVRADRESGLKEILNKMKDVEEEHSWVYIPCKKLWVDTTLAAVERSVYTDPIILQAFHEKYGNIEIFHTHPETLVYDVRKERKFRMSHLVSGALPTSSDLLTIVRYAWNWPRDIPFSSGVIHPLGVSYYTVTIDLLRTDGMALHDVGTTLYDVELMGNDLEGNIQTLVRKQAAANIIETSHGEARYGFSIEYFSQEQFSHIDAWLSTHAVALPRGEHGKK